MTDDSKDEAAATRRVHSVGWDLADWQKVVAAAEVLGDRINPSDTLQYRSAREHEDERHICPLQLGVIRRAIELWTNPEDLVLSPFAGIGSEGVVALETGRRFLGMELKRSYFEQARRNLEAAHERTVDLYASTTDSTTEAAADSASAPQ